ncbi:ThiF family adenylyltransferase, partial [Pseudomonas sp. KHB2.9]
MVMSTEDPRFAGVARLYGIEGLERLKAAHVAIVGVGGVGSWAAEAIARCGVGEISLFDLDDVCVSNSNRQLHALDSTVGKPKVEVMA